MSGPVSNRPQQPRPAAPAQPAQSAQSAGAAVGAAASQAARSVGSAVGAAASSVAGAVGSAAGRVADAFKDARLPGGEAGKTASGFIRGGCCLPPPNFNKPPFGGPPGLGGGLGSFDIKGALLKMDAKDKKAEFDKAAGEAFKDGKVTDKERRNVDSAGRDWNIADKKVDLHEAQKAHKAAIEQAKADGRLTPAEQAKINQANEKVETLQKQLKGLETEDKKLDQQDKWADMFDNIKLPDFKLPDFKLPDFKLPDLKPGGIVAPDMKPGGKLPPFNPGDFCRPPGGGLDRLPFPSLPSFPRPPALDFKPFLLQAPKLDLF